jgi:hypothetical protein
MTIAAPSLQTEILIEATAEHVWEVLTNFKCYPQWNPLISEVRGQPVVGERLHATVAMGRFLRFPIRPRVILVEAPTELRWRGRLPIRGLFSGEHYFRIESRGNGQVSLIHGEVYGGLLRHVFFNGVGRLTRSAFDTMNEALKRRVEGTDASALG